MSQAITEELGNLIVESSQLLSQSQSQEAVDLLKEHSATFQSHPVYLQSLGEALLENGDLNNAYEVLQRACDLDPESRQGVEKFLYLGQIVGGEKGVELLQTGVNRLLSDLDQLMKGVVSNNADDGLQLLFAAYKTPQGIRQYINQKLNQAIFAIIEIWMTDLCEEPQAESECEKWIQKALEVDPENPEAWSLLASIRISQMKNEEAVKAIERSWQLFREKKSRLEIASKDDNMSSKGESDASDLQMAYIEMAEPILTLAKYAIEMGLFENAALIAAAVQDINEQIQNGISKDEGRQVSLDFTKFPLNAKVERSDPSYESISNARNAFTGGFKLLQADSVLESTDKDVKKAVYHLLKELGGPAKSKSNADLDIDDNTWNSIVESIE
ncbi:hypothetical protein HII13_003621 [Brettanomyces bruxellensis]|nr:hypothetical protein HII13_003621 [Brettanomyces bruxellensis]